MRRVMRQVGVSPSARPLGAPAAIDDPAIRPLVEDEARRAYERGLVEGEARGRAEAEATGSALAASVAQALQVARSSSDRIASELAGRCNEIALAAARMIVGEVDEAAEGIVHRVRTALAVVDERPVVVKVHPDDVEAVRTAGGHEVEVEIDPSLQRGEARVGGRWCDADLTWAAIWSQVREVLDVE